MDLFSATHVHRLLQALLGLPTPLYRHHDLLAGMDGKRLAKRNGGQTLADLRAAGADPERLITDLRRNVFPVGISIANAYIEAMTTFQIGRAHVWTPVTNAQLLCRLLL